MVTELTYHNLHMLLEHPRLCYSAVLSVDVITGMISCSNQCDNENVTCFEHDPGWVEADSFIKGHRVDSALGDRAILPYITPSIALLLDNTNCTHLHRYYPSINNPDILYYPLAFVQKKTSLVRHGAGSVEENESGKLWQLCYYLWNITPWCVDNKYTMSSLCETYHIDNGHCSQII